jgi:hypothetical protein
VDLPQRPGARKRDREHSVAEEPEAQVVELLTARAELQDVVGDVESMVVDPERLAHPR